MANKKEKMMYCKECGAQIADNATICLKCGVPTDLFKKAAPSSPQGNKALRMVIPIGRSGYAIAAGYLALFSVLCIPAPLALVFGILALKDIKKNPEKTGKGRAYFGIIMGCLFSILLVVVMVGALSGK